MPRPDPQIAAHLEWIGFVRPTGLVVSAPALVKGRCDPEPPRHRRPAAAARVRHRRRRHRHRRSNPDGSAAAAGGLPFLRRDCAGLELLSRRDTRARSRSRSPTTWGCAYRKQAAFSAPISQSEPRRCERLSRHRRSHPNSPSRAQLQESQPPPQQQPQPPQPSPPQQPQPPPQQQPQPSPWQLLVSVISTGEGFDRATTGGLDLSAHSRMERLLRHSRAPTGLIFNGSALRLISPRRPVRTPAGSTSRSSTCSKPRAGRSAPRCANCSDRHASSPYPRRSAWPRC